MYTVIVASNTVVRVQKANTIMGREYPDREVLASSGTFGQKAWACVSQERAEARFLEALSISCIDSDESDTPK